MERCLNILTHVYLVCGLLSTVNSGCTAGSFPVNASAFIICDFLKDLRESMSDFRIIYTPFGGKQKIILACNWDRSSKSLECTNQSSTEYAFHQKVTNEVRLSVLSVSPRTVGQYSCQQFPVIPATNQSCNLTIQDQTVYDAASVAVADLGKNDSHTIDDNTTVASSSSSSTTVYISVAVSGCISVIAAVTICVFCVRKRRKDKKNEVHAAQLLERKNNVEANSKILPTNCETAKEESTINGVKDKKMNNKNNKKLQRNVEFRKEEKSICQYNLSDCDLSIENKSEASDDYFTCFESESSTLSSTGSYTGMSNSIAQGDESQIPLKGAGLTG